MPDLNDLSLVLRCINGDKSAWDRFVERFSPLVFWAIKRRLRQAGYPCNQQDIEDIFQNVFCLLWEKDKLRQIKNRENISTWLVMVAANCTHNYFRNKREILSDKELLAEKAAVFDCPTANKLEQERIENTINDVFTYLPPRELIILKLNYFYNKTHQEISQILRMPASTVSSIIKRGKEKLRVKLKEQGWENF